MIVPLECAPQERGAADASGDLCSSCAGVCDAGNRSRPLDILRGSQPVGPATFTRWSGLYAGGQFGYTNGNAPFSNATQSGIAYAFRETTLENEFNVSQWPTLGTANETAPSYGGFVGYNTQW